MRLCLTNFCTSSACFAKCFVSQPNYTKCTQIVQKHQNMTLGCNGEDRVRLLRKIPTRLCGMNLCTSSACFAPSFVRQPTFPNAHKWYKTHQNVSLGSNGVDRVRSLRKILMRLHGTNFCTWLANFALCCKSISSSLANRVAIFDFWQKR